ncbi:MAG: preprotein translocase subunit YajC [Treponema sp.]|nr:preprotein translocase subunit YajC [Treponema sp.]
MSILSLLQAAPNTSTTGSFGSLIVTVVLMIGIFYFFLIRPQNKKQKEMEKMLSALKKGDKVVTIGGIHGVVSSTKEKTVILKVDDNTKLEFSRSAIASVVNPEAEKQGAGKASKDAKADGAEKKSENKTENK